MKKSILEKLFSAPAEILEIGYYTPKYQTSEELKNGEIGYIVTGLKEVQECRVGDTVTIASGALAPLPGYKEVKPMVFAGIFPKEGDANGELRDAIDKLKKLEKDKAITEDELKKCEKDVQDVTKSFELKMDEAVAHKEKEVLEV